MTDPTQEQVEAAKAAILAAFNGEAMPKDDNEAAGVLATAAIAELRPWMRGEVAAWEYTRSDGWTTLERKRVPDWSNVNGWTETPLYRGASHE